MNQFTSQISPILLGLCCLAICATPLPSLAVTVEGLPNPQQANEGWVTAMDDRRMEIETGCELAARLPDAEEQQIIRRRPRTLLSAR